MEQFQEHQRIGAAQAVLKLLRQFQDEDTVNHVFTGEIVPDKPDQYVQVQFKTRTGISRPTLEAIVTIFDDQNGEPVARDTLLITAEVKESPTGA